MIKKCPKCKSDMRYEEANYNSIPLASGSGTSGSGTIPSSSCSANKSSGGCWRCDYCGYIEIDKR